MYNLFKKRIDNANKAYSLFDESDKILVALSGGADSVALLLSLKEHYPKLSLYACHVNHMLRADEADRDMTFAESLCNQHGIPIEIIKTDVGAFAEQSGLSTELAARNIRYDFFEKVCKKHGINKVATAHTLSDNVETVLFNMTRGTGLQGLCGIPAKRKLTADITIIRPLIFIKRSEIETYLELKKQDFVTDSSNLTDDYTRNYFRHNIIPLLKNINPSFEESLKKMCASLYNAQLFIDKNVDNNVTNEVSQLAELDDIILSGVIMKLYNKASGKTLLEKIHIDEISRLIKKSAANGFQHEYDVYLPDKLTARIRNGILEFIPSTNNKKSITHEYSIYPKAGINRIDKTFFAVIVSASIPDTPKGYSVYSKEIIDKNAIVGQLYIRNRRSGDTLKQGGMTKKVKELLTHSKIPFETRNKLPFICDDNGIICIPGVAVNDNHKSSKISDENRLFIYIFTQTTL